ncbi:HEPN domain-containing protein [Phascolarctobacterium sp.]|uniref:HEPN domain-containing protein n=1 Tax=Phascolarctobacterium sp. TaxID=2049039 RepID=UPI003868DA09
MDEQAKALSAYRLEKAEQCLRSAEIILNIGDDNNLVINRSYYAIFHGMRSVLALESKDFEKHSAVISYFRKEYIKTGKIPVEASKIIGSAFNTRNDSDYEDFYEPSDEDAKEQFNDATRFIAIIKDYLTSVQSEEKQPITKKP